MSEISGMEYLPRLVCESQNVWCVRGRASVGDSVCACVFQVRGAYGEVRWRGGLVLVQGTTGSFVHKKRVLICAGGVMMMIMMMMVMIMMMMLVLMRRIAEGGDSDDGGDDDVGDEQEEHDVDDERGG